jgi:hypothetical protein
MYSYANVVENLRPIGLIPETESQAREIASGARLFENADAEVLIDG